MKNVSVAFFEIPATDFDRAVKFYEGLFGIRLERFEGGNEKMACFPAEGGASPGAVSWTSDFDFQPSPQGILVHLDCDSVSDCLPQVENLGGKALIPKTRIDSLGRGYFCVIIDSEGNRVGLHSTI